MSNSAAIDVYARLSPICGLCQVGFREGEAFKAIYQRRTGPALAITAHRRCFGQLQPGDLTRVFGALERGLALPLSVLRGGGGDHRDAGTRRRNGEGACLPSKQVVTGWQT